MEKKRAAIGLKVAYAAPQIELVRRMNLKVVEWRRACRGGGNVRGEIGRHRKRARFYRARASFGVFCQLNSGGGGLSLTCEEAEKGRHQFPAILGLGRFPHSL